VVAVAVAVEAAAEVAVAEAVKINEYGIKNKKTQG